MNNLVALSVIVWIAAVAYILGCIARIVQTQRQRNKEMTMFLLKAVWTARKHHNLLKKMVIQVALRQQKHYELLTLRGDLAAAPGTTLGESGYYESPDGDFVFITSSSDSSSSVSGGNPA